MPPSLARVTICAASGKGGTGKTSLILGLAAEYARRQHRVAIVDLDPQGGATLAAGFVRPQQPLLAPSQFAHGCQLYASGRALANASPEELRARLQHADATSELTLVDLSPALTDAGHAAAFERATLIMIVARTDAAGLTNVEETVQLCRAANRPYLVVPSLHNRTALSRDSEHWLREQYQGHVSTAVIPHDVRAADAAGLGRPVTLSAARSRVSLAIKALASELLCVTGIAAVTGVTQ